LQRDADAKPRAWGRRAWRGRRFFRRAGRFLRRAGPYIPLALRLGKKDVEEK